MLVVSNTSPLSNLAMIDRLELDRLSHPAARLRLAAAFRDGWLQVVPLPRAVPAELAGQLDPGETEALALAMQLPASLVLLDESAARLQATQPGCAHTGVLGILRWAKASRQINSLTTEIRNLRVEARFFISTALEKKLLASVGE